MSTFDFLYINMSPVYSSHAKHSSVDPCAWRIFHSLRYRNQSTLEIPTGKIQQRPFHFYEKLLLVSYSSFLSSRPSLQAILVLNLCSYQRTRIWTFCILVNMHVCFIVLSGISMKKETTSFTSSECHRKLESNKQLSPTSFPAQLFS